MPIAVEVVIARRSQPSDERRILASVVRRQREKVQLSQAELSARIGRPQSLLAEIESARRKLDIFEFIDLARALDMTPDLLLRELITAASPPAHPDGADAS